MEQKGAFKPVSVVQKAILDSASLYESPLSALIQAMFWMPLLCQVRRLSAK